MPENETDWLDVLLRIISCVHDHEGTYFEDDWRDYGVTEEQQREIEKAMRQEPPSLS